MVLDKILIGTRIRKIREEIFEESRSKFAQRCDLKERYIGQVERGEFLLSLECLNKIVSATGVDINYILYGIEENKNLKPIENLHHMINISNSEEAMVYYKCICTVKSYLNKTTKK